MLTVLLATKNRSQVFRSVLECFCKLTQPQSGWKLIVVDNGSSDGTDDVLASFSTRLPLTSVSEKKPGKNFALNAGLDLIEGDLAVLTDDDVFPDENWLVHLRTAADKLPDFTIFGGPIRPYWETPPPSWIEWADMGAAFAVTDPSWKEGPIPANCVWGPNMAIRTGVFRSGIRFDTSIGPRGANYVQGGDTELTRRLERQGHKAWHVLGASVRHYIRREQLDRRWVMRRAVRHGRGEYRLGHASEATTRRLLFGTPRYLYRKLYHEARKTVAAVVLGNQGELFRSRWRFNYVRGEIQEARILVQESVKRAPSSHSKC